MIDIYHQPKQLELDHRDEAVACHQWTLKESTDTVKWRKMIDIYHQPKQLEIIELKLEIDSEKERKSKPKHETHIIMMRQLASKFTSISRGRVAAHLMPSTKQSVGGRKCDRLLVLFGQSVHFEETSSEPLPNLFQTSSPAGKWIWTVAVSVRRPTSSRLFISIPKNKRLLPTEFADSDDDVKP